MHFPIEFLSSLEVSNSFTCTAIWPTEILCIISASALEIIHIKRQIVASSLVVFWKQPAYRSCNAVYKATVSGPFSSHVISHDYHASAEAMNSECGPGTSTKMLYRLLLLQVKTILFGFRDQRKEA